MLSKFIQTLRDLGLDPTAQEVADILWLASCLDAPSRDRPSTSLPEQPESSLPEIPELDKEKGSRQSSAPTRDLRDGRLYAGQAVHKTPSSPESGALPFHSPGVPALPGALAIGRALRPLMRRTPSRIHKVMDEVATARYIAETRHWIPQLHPAAERWLELVLVIDAEPSMAPWHQTITELRRLLAQHGAFRDLQTWQFTFDADERQLHLYTNPQVSRSPYELLDPRGRRVILVVSDCVSSAWYNGAITDMINLWGRYSPVSILQMLPQRLWIRTALGEAEPVQLRASLPAVSNTHLVKIKPQEEMLGDLEPKDEEGNLSELDNVEPSEGKLNSPQSDDLPVPIVTLEPHALSVWAQLIAGNGNVSMPGRVLSTIPLEEFEIEQDPTSQLSAEERVQLFHKTASPLAKRLAGYLAAVPLTLPVMRLVQRAMLPESNQTHLAEVFLSGLLERRTEDVAAVHPDDVEYDFVKGVRELLTSTTRISETVDVLTHYISQRIGQPLDFQALVADPESLDPSTIEALGLPFARVTRQALRYMGGRYMPLAMHLEQHITSQTNIIQILGERTEKTIESALELEESLERDDTETIERAPRFTAEFLSNLTADLTAHILDSVGRRVREALLSIEKQQALRRCVEAGLVALLAQAIANITDASDQILLQVIFTDFFHDRDVARELALLLHGRTLNMEELRYLFTDAGYDPDILPNLNFTAGVIAFECAFAEIAIDEPALQDVLRADTLLKQTQVQNTLLAEIQSLVAALKQSVPGSVSIMSKQIYAINVVDGSQIKIYKSGGAEVNAGEIAAIGSIQDIIRGAGPSGSPAYLRAAYLSHIFERVGHLSLAGIDPKAAGERVETRLDLGAVYTALLTLTPEEHEQERSLMPPQSEKREGHHLSALAQLDQHGRLVLLGEPGSGKSTFVNFVALCMAGALLKQATDTSEDDALALLPDLSRLTEPLPSEDEGKDKGEKPQPWTHGALLPVHVVLRDFAARGLPPPGEPATAKHLWAFIVTELDQASLGEYAKPLAQTLSQEGGLLLLDGLDEVPDARYRREQIKQAVTDFAAVFPRCRILVTSRTYAYQQQAWRLPGFAEAVLAPFGEGQIRRFVDRWYVHIASKRGIHPEDAAGRAALLKRAIFSSDRLCELAERPLLLTLTASLHAWRGGSLPENRAELYADTVDLLLDWWERPKTVRDAKGRPVVQQPSLAEWLRVERAQVRNLLNTLAYNAHAEQPDLRGTADVQEGDLLSGLMHLSPNPEVHPALLLSYLSQRAGVLLPRGEGVYTFPHRSFQEYLAACYLTDHGYPDRIAELARADPNRWREVTLLAGAKSARGSDFALWALVDALCYLRMAEGEELKSAGAWGALLAGQALVESADLGQVSARNQAKLRRVRQHLVYVLQGGGQLPPIERAEAGNALAKLEDPRFRTDAWYLPNDPLLGFIEIPEGGFLMGESKEQHELMLPTYYIGRYPVTVAQYKVFAESNFYRGDIRFLRSLENHPVTWVTWHEALAYCRWLTEVLQDSEGTPKPLVDLLQDGWQVMLPSEAEWEKAAGWDLAKGEPRTYPWGEEPDPERANYTDTGIGTTSTVGCFQKGASAYGVEELCGNVWEWTRTLWGKSFSEPEFKYPYDVRDGREDLTRAEATLRVLRGGAFSVEEWGIRCASRLRYYPDFALNDLGFRVCLVPQSRLTL